MREPRNIWDTAADLAAGSRAFVMVTVIRAKGSTPRNAGARMIWLPEAGFVGTVGGGQFEHLVLADARRCYESRSCTVHSYTLGADADQCCGGVMEVFFEFHGPSRRVVLFGAGHVSEKVASMLRDAPLELVVVDDRPDWNSAERFPGASRVLDWDVGLREASAYPHATLAVVMTCSHDRDFELARALLIDEARRPAFVGLIGSRSKRACFLSRLAGAGVTEGAIEHLRCPVGLGDMGKEPSLVAVSITGQLLLEAQRIGTL